MALLPPEEVVRRTALFQRENWPEETRESSAVDWEAASPDSKSMDLARVWISVGLSDLGGASVAVEEVAEGEVPISFPISLERRSYSSRALAAAARSFSTSLSVPPLSSAMFNFVFIPRALMPMLLLLMLLLFLWLLLLLRVNDLAVEDGWKACVSDGRKEEVATIAMIAVAVDILDDDMVIVSLLST